MNKYLIAFYVPQLTSVVLRPDQTPRSVTSDLVMHCLVCLCPTKKTLGLYGLPDVYKATVYK